MLNNVKSELSKTDKGKLSESGFFLAKEEKPSSFFITASSNAIVNLGDAAIDNKLTKETKKVITSKEAWDMTFSEAYESYSTMTFIFIGSMFKYVQYS